MNVLNDNTHTHTGKRLLWNVQMDHGGGNGPSFDLSTSLQFTGSPEEITTAISEAFSSIAKKIAVEWLDDCAKDGENLVRMSVNLGMEAEHIDNTEGDF